MVLGEHREGYVIIDVDIPFTGFVSALTNSRIHTVGRYFCDPDSEHNYKLIQAPEAKELAHAKIRVFSIFEQAVDFTKGTAHADIAMNCAKAIGQPARSAIYFGLEKSDGGFTDADVGQIRNYFADIKNRIAGKFKIGIYSNGTPCLAMKGLVDYTMLAAASYTHSGTWDFYTQGTWSLAQVGPLDIDTNKIPGTFFPHRKIPWTLDVNYANGDFGAFMPNAPSA
jgi:hypothetical protein